MTRFFLKIYDFFSGRKALAITLLVIITAACAFLSTRIHYEEDISKFLPSDPETDRYSEIYNAIGEKNNIILIFSAAGIPSNDVPATRNGDATEADSPTRYDIEDAMDDFGEKLSEADTAGLITGMQISVDADRTDKLVEEISSNWPLYMTEGDYRRADSLLRTPGYVDAAVKGDSETMLIPGASAFAENIQKDPLHLFTPVLTRLASSARVTGFNVSDDYIFTEDGEGVAFLTSPYGGSESGKNSLISKLIEEVSAKVEAEHQGIKISATGAPLIAAANADRIKKDSTMAIAIAVTLILLFLCLTYRRFSDILLIAISIAFGWIFALGCMSLIRDSMSIIVIGISSVIIGIAVNYPLHFMDGLKGGITPRENLRDMVSPLLIGNITTIGAFLCLVALKTRAMQDLGLFSSLMLAGTIIFVLIFLPLFSRKRKKTGDTFEPGKILPDKVPTSPWLFAGVCVFVVVMAIFSRGVRFDSDMWDINYMTSEQKEALKILNAGKSGGANEIYAVAEGASLESALQANDSLQRAIGRLSDEGIISSAKGAGAFTPSVKEQEKRIRRWKSFRDSLLKFGIMTELDKACKKYGFKEGAFSAFTDSINKEFTPSSLGSGSPTVAAFEGTGVVETRGGWSIVNTLSYNDSESEASIRSAVTSCPDASAFSTADVSSRLVKILSESFDYIGAVCGLIVFIFLCLSFRNLELSIISFLPLAAAWYIILGAMSILGVSFNIVNIILATFIFGQGDDYTIFITEGLVYEYAYGRKRLATYKNSVFNSAVIMLIGIGSLAFAAHPALSSLGKVTLLGMFTVVLMAWYLPPVIFKWLTEKNGIRRDVPITLKRLLYSLFSLIGFVLAMYLWVYPRTFFHFLIKGNGEKSKRSYHIFLQRTARFFINHIPGVKYSLHLSESQVFDTPSIIISNHASHLDLMCLMMLSPRIVFVTNEWAWKNPLYSYVLRKADCIPITGGLEANLDRLRGLVDEGYSVAIFPEGTRSLDGKIGRFHKGAFYAASRLGLSIIPVFIHGSGDVLPKTDFMLREGSIDVEIGEKRSPQGDYHYITKEFHRRYLQWQEEAGRKYETPEYLSKHVYYKYYYMGAEARAEAMRCLKSK